MAEAEAEQRSHLSAAFSWDFLRTEEEVADGDEEGVRDGGRYFRAQPPFPYPPVASLHRVACLRYYGSSPSFASLILPCLMLCTIPFYIGLCFEED